MSDLPSVDLYNTEVAFATKSDEELNHMRWLFKMMNNQLLVNLGSWVTLRAVKFNFPFATKIIEKTFYDHFCGGTTIFDCQSKIDKLYIEDIVTILDYGAEAKATEEDFDRTEQEISKAIDFAASNASVPVTSIKLTGIGRFELLEKIQAGKMLKPEEKVEFEALRQRLFNLCEHAEKRKVGLMIDAEETWVQDVMDDLVNEMMRLFNKKRVVVYNTFQMYRKDKLEDLKRAFEKARRNDYLLGAKLVRGAYMNKERERALEKGYQSPIQETKEDTDRDYNEALRFCVENYEYIGSCNATHNADSCKLQAQLIAEKDIPNNHAHLNFCQLYGMSDYITFNLADMGFNVAKYLPYGPVKDVIPYLIRRAQENTSVTGDMSRELGFIEEEIRRRKMNQH